MLGSHKDLSWDPILFIIFVTSLPDSVKCKCVVYADDTTLLMSSLDPVTFVLLCYLVISMYVHLC